MYDKGSVIAYTHSQAGCVCRFGLYSDIYFNLLMMIGDFSGRNNSGGIINI